ncbi:MAG: TldD/PmbA family protein [Chloroflexota bacterium]
MDRALNVAALKGATYADVRVVERRHEGITVKNGRVEAVSLSHTSGFGVRVLLDGSWGFASSADLSAAKAEQIAAFAVAIARASARVKARAVRLAPAPVARDTYRTPLQQDPFDVAVDAKIALLLAADERMRRVAKIGVAESSITAFRETKTFANSEGSYVEQEITETGCGIEATAVAEGEVQRRSYPNSVGRHTATAGWEFVEQYDLVGNAERVASEAAQLLTAPTCPGGVRTIILDPTQVALQVHESCGHPTELDRVFGTEASYAGTSFLTPEKLGTFRYGSDVVNITADATVPGGLGTFGYDDEGVAAQRTPLVRNGLFVGYLTSRDTAVELAEVLGGQGPQAPNVPDAAGHLTSNGTARADGWNRIPIIRMTNINLEPGEWRLEDVIADTDDGLYLETNKSWSIDDRRLNFQFGTEWCREIKGGKLGAIYKNATYTGITPRFWGGCDAVCREWQVWGTPNCGKGQPSQVAHVGHGAAAARFRNVQVGVMK